MTLLIVMGTLLVLEPFIILVILSCSVENSINLYVTFEPFYSQLAIWYQVQVLMDRELLPERSLMTAVYGSTIVSAITVCFQGTPNKLVECKPQVENCYYWCIKKISVVFCKPFKTIVL